MSVTYNAENRPVRWEQGDVVITMDFDRMGRRVFYKEEVNGEVVTYHKFVYDNYLCVQKLDALNGNSQINLFVWDPTESVATRPLFMLSNPGSYKFFYTFDGNKNVSELVHFETRNGIAAHYDYAPFGAVTRAVNTSAIFARDFHLENPFRFSSEYHDDTLGLVYYNYRHYNPTAGRWCGRDFITKNNYNPYLYVNNAASINFDILGLDRRLIYWSSKSNDVIIYNAFTFFIGEIELPWLHAEISVDLWECQGGRMVKIGEERYGFKAKGLNVFSTRGGVFKADDTHGTIFELIRSSTSCEDIALYEELQRMRMNPPQYRLMGYNCYNFAIEMFFYGLGEY